MPGPLNPETHVLYRDPVYLDFRVAMTDGDVIAIPHTGPIEREAIKSIRPVNPGPPPPTACS